MEFLCPAKPSPWTDERIDLLRDLYQHGSIAWVARQLNQRTGSTFNRNAVIGKMTRLNLHRTPVESQRATRIRNKKAKAPKIVWKPPAVAAPLPLPKPQEPPLPFLGLSLFDLKDNQCRYPEGDGPFFFCAQPTVDDNTPYCLFHYRLCNSPVPKPRGGYFNVFA